MSRPLLSVIVPTYNRPKALRELIDSVVSQSFTDWEMVIGEDCSPARDTVKAMADEYAERTGGRVRCNLNEENLGYDRGLRRLVELARGRFLIIMGDDDLLRPGAFATIADIIRRYPNVGMMLRAVSYFHGTPDNVLYVTRYFPDERLFPAGQSAIVTAFRRVCGMSGLVVDRDLAQSYATDRWDGSLFYQHWLVGNVLAEKDLVCSPTVLVDFRQGEPPMFGMASAERHLYTPGVQPPDTHLKMVRYQLEIAAAIEEERGIELLPLLRRDYANYGWALLKGQAHLPSKEFDAYYRDLCELGLGQHLSFRGWYWAVRLVGVRRLDQTLRWVRRVVGYTPNLTRVGRKPAASPASSRVNTATHP
jgi:abequosyltransferase